MKVSDATVHVVDYRDIDGDNYSYQFFLFVSAIL